MIGNKYSWPQRIDTWDKRFRFRASVFQGLGIRVSIACGLALQCSRVSGDLRVVGARRHRERQKHQVPWAQLQR